MGKPKDKEVIRWALLDAIEWERSLWGAYANVNTDEGKAVKKHCESKIASFNRLLAKRYGGVPADPMANAKNVDIRDI